MCETTSCARTDPPSTVADSTDTGRAARYRDPFIDVVRALSIVVVVVGHWIMPVLRDSGGTLTAGNALATPGWWLVTWPLQVMPVFFFAGGAAHHHSFVASNDLRRWLSLRLARLIVPALPLVAVWLVVPDVLREFGVPAQAVTVASTVVGQPLWFLAVYVIAVAAVPLAHVAHRQWGLAVPVVLGAAALGVDALRLHGVPLVGYVNEILVWLAISQLGLAYAAGSALRRRAVPMAVGGFGTAAALVLFGHYPASMVGLPGQVSNMSPATACLLCVGVGQIGVLLVLRERVARLAQRWWLRAVGARCMTVYLWHMSAMVVVAAVAVLGFRYATPAPGSIGWFLATPLWIAAAAVVLWLLVLVFGRFDAIRPAAGMPAPARLVGAVLLTCAGFLGISAFGFGDPLIAAGCATLVLTGVVLALPGALVALACRCVGTLLDAIFR